MKHIFDIDIAKEYGINAAIILENIGYWVRQNEANGTNFFDGRFWTYNSRRAYRELFPYMSTRQIDTAFKKLIDGGLIITGNYNKLAYDRTLWYALTEKGKCILHFDGMETHETAKGFQQNEGIEPAENGEPIPDINTDQTPDKNTGVSIIKAGPKPRKQYSDYMPLNDAIHDFIEFRKGIKKPMTDKAIELLIKKLNGITSNLDEQIEILNQSIVNGWQGIFPLKADHQRTRPAANSGNVFLDIARDEGIF